MSAFVVDNRTIDYLVTWVHRHSSSRCGPICTKPVPEWRTVDDVPEPLRDYIDGPHAWSEPGKFSLRVGQMHPTDIGKILLAENVRSVAHRYGGRLDSPELSAAVDYYFRPVMQDLLPGWVVKSCACLDYQSCETEEWPSTVAHAIMEAIKSDAIRELTEDCPWGVTDADLFRRQHEIVAAYEERATVHPLAVGCRA
jgi:hypothetical protein